jgi:hypothetical protein
MMEKFLIEFKEYTIIWLLLSSVLGGIIGAAIKIFSENIISQNVSLNKIAREHFNDYSFKLLKAAKSLDKRLDFIINDKKIFAYEERNSKLSFYYAFGNYFGWCKIIQEEAIDKFKRLPKTVMRFNITFLQTLKGLSSNFYFIGHTEIEHIIAKNAVIPNYCHTAISDLMLADIDSNKTIIKSPILSFSEFCKKYDNDDEFKTWFIYFEKFIQKMEFEKDNLNWNRFLIISINLKVLINQLDRRNRFSAPYSNLNHLEHLKKETCSKVLDDFRFLKSKKISIPAGFKFNLVSTH